LILIPGIAVKQSLYFDPRRTTSAKPEIMFISEGNQL